MSGQSSINPDAPIENKLTINEKNLVVSFIQFLRHKVSSKACTDDQIEAMEAVQCLESAFEVSDKNYAFQTSKPLLEIFTAAEGLPELEGDFPTPLPAEIDAANRLKEQGNELAKSGNWDEAVVKYNEAIKLHYDPIFFCNRAAAYCRLEQNDLAIQDCRTAIALDPKYAKAWGRMGVALSNQARYEQAVEAYKKALEIEPANASYQQNLSIAEDKLREGQQAARATGANPLGGISGLPGSLGNMLNNPQMMEFATQMMSDPNVQNVMSQMMNSFSTGLSTGTGGGNIEGFLRAGEAMAQQMEQQNPELIAQLRNTFGRREDGQPDDQPGSGGNNGHQH